MMGGHRGMLTHNFLTPSWRIKMKTKITLAILALILLISVKSNAGEVSGKYESEIFRVEVGKNYKDYSKSDLQRRVWELERAVFQLQQKVFELSAAEPVKTWACTIDAMGDVYTGDGETKAVASTKAIENCKKERHDGFFCKNPKCGQ
jgi:hypothetical protein